MNQNLPLYIVNDEKPESLPGLAVSSVTLNSQRTKPTVTFMPQPMIVAGTRFVGPTDALSSTQPFDPSMTASMLSIKHLSAKGKHDPRQ